MWSATPNDIEQSLVPSVARRVGFVMRIGILVAGLVLIIGLTLLAVANVLAGLWFIPVAAAVAIIIGAVLLLQRPIWGADVPDGQLWALVNARGQITSFIEAGVHWITPVQVVVPYTEAGLVQLSIALDPVLTADHYPYRIAIALSLILNPLSVAPAEYKKLRQITRQGLIDSLSAEISGQIRAAFLQKARADNAPSVLIEAVQAAVAGIIADYDSIGLSLNTRNAILIDLAPPAEVINARTAQWVRETQTEAGVNHLASMLEMAGGYNVSANQLGQLHFSLNMPPGTPITFKGTQGATIEVESPRVPPRLPANTEPPPPPTVIDTRPDAQGNYVPADPILSRRSKNK